MSESTTIVRHHRSITNVNEIPDVLDAIGERFRWVVGILQWHDGYWERKPNALPGAFLNDLTTEMWAKPRAEFIDEAIVWGDGAQVRIARRGSQWKLVLLYKGEPKDFLSPSWSAGRSDTVHVRVSSSLCVQNPNAFPYAKAQGSFDSALFGLIQKHGISIEEYRIDGEHFIDWRFCAPEGDMRHE